jgi:signal peptidase I
MRKARKPWLSGLLSLTCPGLGHLYNGSLAAAVVAGVSTCLAMALGTHLGVHGLRGVLAYFVLVGAWTIGLAAHASRDARRNPEIALTRFQSLPAYVAFAVAASVLGWVIKPLYRVEPVYVSTTSMIPSIVPGDLVIADLHAYRRRAPATGELVIVRARDGETRYRFGRVLGVPGDRVEVRDNDVRVNDVPLERRPLSEESFDETRWMIAPIPDEGSPTVFFAERAGTTTYVVGYDPKIKRPAFGPETVPPDKLLVLGDNRDYAPDGRHEGWISFEDVLGRPLFVYASLAPSRPPRVRWPRGGLTLK